MRFFDKKVLVIGSARSGLAVSKLLIKEGANVTLTDQNEITNKNELAELGINVYDEGHPDHLRNTDWDFIVKNPGIPYYVPFVKWFVDHHLNIYTEVEIAYRCAPKFHYGAITGTNGKTTITSILFELLKYNKTAVVAGNIGSPLSEIVLKHGDEEKYVALELSNFQLLGIEAFHPEVSVICNLKPDHLDYMKSVEAYYESKVKITQNQQGSDWFLRNVDDENVLTYAKNINCEIIDYSLVRQDVDLYVKDQWVYLHKIALFDINCLKIVGRHNLSNAMVAACMAYKLNVSIENIRKGISEFKSIEHRLEFCGEVKGIKFFNDSKATNSDAVVPALSSFEGNIILLAGGHDKGIPFDALTPFDDKVKCCVSFGETKHKFEEIFTRVSICEDIQSAFQYAISIANVGDVILLSPACSSYDQFKSYEHRGQVFKELVSNYITSLK